jgi:hypothetical protein
LFAVLITVGVGAQRPAAAQDALACGDAAMGFVSGTGVNSYGVDVAAGTVGFLQGSFISDEAGDTLRIHVTGDGVDEETCSNVITFESNGGPITVEVSPCFGGPGGNYLLNFHVVSSGDELCGFPLGCGATPDGIELAELGEVDSYRFAGQPDGEVEIYVDDLDQGDSEYLLRVFDPSGRQMSRVCRDSIEVHTQSSGEYTLLVGSCGSLSTGEYRLELEGEDCPRGPVVTSMAFLPQDRDFVLPVAYDRAGRAVFESGGNGTLIVEGRVGSSLRGIGDAAYEPGALPPFQAIVSRDLGDGNPAVCDRNAIPPGGIAATVPFGFRGDRQSIDRINDLGCRFDNGQGETVGRRDPLNSCVRGSFAFVDPSTDIQFCADFANSEIFPPGDTIVAARMSDLAGVVGPVREIVVRVAGNTPTPTATHTSVPSPPTRTPTRTPTRRPTARPPGPCTCDCDDSGEVRVSELTRCVRIALGTSPLSVCPAGDRNDDGEVGIGELVVGVNNALIGCPPPLTE